MPPEWFGQALFCIFALILVALAMAGLAVNV